MKVLLLGTTGRTGQRNLAALMLDVPEKNLYVQEMPVVSGK